MNIAMFAKQTLAYSFCEIVVNNLKNEYYRGKKILRFNWQNCWIFIRKISSIELLVPLFSGKKQTANFDINELLNTKNQEQHREKLLAISQKSKALITHKNPKTHL